MTSRLALVIVVYPGNKQQKVYFDGQSDYKIFVKVDRPD